MKRIIPSFIWNFCRKIYYGLLNFISDLGPNIRNTKYCGINIYYNKNNSLIRRLKKDGIFESDMSEAIVNKLKHIEDPIFIDIGANIGLISAYVISKIRHVIIHAFEPGTAQRNLLIKTVENNKIQTSISVYSEALGDKNETVSFFEHNPKEAAMDGLKDTGRRGQTKAINVQMITLDSWWNSIGKPKVSVIKIDTEGAELLVLRGGENFIKQVKPIIFLEIEPANLKVYPYTEWDIFEWFEKINYNLEIINKDTYMGCPIQQ